MTPEAPGRRTGLGRFFHRSSRSRPPDRTRPTRRTQATSLLGVSGTPPATAAHSPAWPPAHPHPSVPPPRVTTTDSIEEYLGARSIAAKRATPATASPRGGSCRETSTPQEPTFIDDLDEQSTKEICRKMGAKIVSAKNLAASPAAARDTAPTPQRARVEPDADDSQEDPAGAAPAGAAPAGAAPAGAADPPAAAPAPAP